MDYKNAMKLANQLCFPLYAAARSVTSLYTPFLRPLGLTYTQYLVMLVLWEEDGVRVSDLCESLMLDSGTLSPLLKKLEGQGLIERKRSSDDERVVLICLTASGRHLQEMAKDVPARVGGCLELSPEKAAEMYSLLYELLDGLRKRNEKENSDDNSF